MAGAGVAGVSLAPRAAANGESPDPEGFGVLVDTTECIGCRKCEWSCAQANKLSDKPLEAFEDTSVFESPRRMTAGAYTVVNRHADPENPEKPTFVKAQCMHCLRPACASACLVGALRRQDNGAVSYDPWKCMGCRYCMVACPFQVPAYEYNNALTPVVSKCSFCFERVRDGGGPPACVDMCPPMCLTFAKRGELLELARGKIATNPGRYLNHIYGEHELGGTSWMYLTSRPVTELGLLEFGEKPIPEYTEPLQHGIFKYGLPPMLLFGLLATAMKTFDSKEEEE
ncbi:MAG: 4Fe-4S dicluster domain-containing protein [Candidatus Hydrogenedens sp.]|nr:4Fe-4S dicluster domain-containing protein [Candidatus Hydrogenedentota bacterium]NLF59022.1 4Fe-4S dicluster domain-containing protein [Candidatus Hydrogenedens sp.]